MRQFPVDWVPNFGRLTAWKVPEKWLFSGPWVAVRHCRCCRMEVYIDMGYPKWMVYDEKSYENGWWFGGTLILGNHHMTLSNSRQNRMVIVKKDLRALNSGHVQSNFKCVPWRGKRKFRPISTSSSTFHPKYVLTSAMRRIFRKSEGILNWLNWLNGWLTKWWTLQWASEINTTEFNGRIVGTMLSN